MTLLCLSTMVIPINKSTNKMTTETVNMNVADKHLQHTPGLLALKIRERNMPYNSSNNKIKINYNCLKRKPHQPYLARGSPPSLPDL